MFILLVLAHLLMMEDAYFMPDSNRLERKRSRFYKEPTEEDIQANGYELATVNARVRARIIGSRIMTATVALGIGTALTAEELATGTDGKPVDFIANFVIPVIINGVAELKVERQLHQTAQEVGELLQDMQNANDNRDDNPPPMNEE